MDQIKEFIKNCKSCLINKKKEMKFAKKRKIELQKDYDAYMKQHLKAMEFCDFVIEDVEEQMKSLNRMILKYEDKLK